MCKIAGVEVSIKKITFERRGYITFYLEDGRIIFSPLKNWPEIKKLTAKQRNDYTIFADQYFGFIPYLSETYCITDVLTLTPGEKVHIY